MSTRDRYLRRAWQSFDRARVDALDPTSHPDGSRAVDPTTLNRADRRKLERQQRRAASRQAQADAAGRDRTRR
jgi:hypothetical protein